MSLSIALIAVLLLAGKRLYADEGGTSQDGGGTHASGQGNAQDGGNTGNQTKTYTEEDVKKLREEAAAHRVEKQEARQKLAEAEAKLAEIEKAKLSELDRAKQEKTEAELKIVAMSERLRQGNLRANLAVLAQEFNVVDLDVLSALVQTQEISYTGEGEPEGLREKVEKLLKDKPFLVKAGASGNSGSAGNASRTGGSKEANYSYAERRGLGDPSLWKQA